MWTSLNHFQEFATQYRLCCHCSYEYSWSPA